MNQNTISSDMQNQIDQLFSTILKQQTKINHIKDADEDKKHLTAEYLDKFSNLRGRGFFYNYFSTGKGHGPFTQLIDGSVKYDLINSIGVNLLGHSHPLQIKSNLEAACSDTMMCGNLLPYSEAYEASNILIDAVKEKSRLKNFWFAGSGSFANDTALKMAWQKRAPRHKVLAFEKAFAGRSVATQDITFNEAYRVDMPKNIEVVHIPHFDQNDPTNAVSKTISALEAAWTQDPDGYAVLMLELIQGEGGFIYGDRDYYVAVFEWAKQKNIPIWIDEVQTFGRTHQLFAFQMFELDEYVDLVTIGKAFQSCGVLYTDEMCPKPGLVAGTFNGSIAALKMSYKTVRLLTEGNFYGPNGRMADLEKKFKLGLGQIQKNVGIDKLGYVGGIGTMLSFEVGKADKDDTTKFLKSLFDNHIVCFSAGSNPTRVRFLLPITLTEAHIAEIMDIIEKSINDIF